VGCLLTVASASGPLIAQDKPAVEIKITPSQSETESETQPAESDEPFSSETSVPAGGSLINVTRMLEQGNETYKNGDLLTWEMVKPVLARLRRANVPMPPEKVMQAKFLRENDPLVKMLSTERGKAFFQQLAKKPSSIDLVDRYRELPLSERFLREFIRDVDGYKFFTESYWLTSERAADAESIGLLNASNGSKLGQPTGRIYLETQLIAFLAEYRKSGTTRTYD
jgi:hypothetical protein